MAAKGRTTVVLNTKTGKMLVDIDAPDRQCEQVEAVMNAMFRAFGLEPEDRQSEGDPRPKQAEGTQAPNRVKH